MRQLAIIGFFLTWLSVGVTGKAQAPIPATFEGRIVDLISSNGISDVSVTATQTCYFGNGSSPVTNSVRINIK